MHHGGVLYSWLIVHRALGVRPFRMLMVMLFTGEVILE